MKKFIGKAQGIDKEMENDNIFNLKEVLENDEASKKVFSKQCGKVDKEGNGFITKSQFLKIMQLLNVSDRLLLLSKYTCLKI